jgi:hypothetical protein
MQYITKTQIDDSLSKAYFTLLYFTVHYSTVHYILYSRWHAGEDEMRLDE